MARWQSGGNRVVSVVSVVPDLTRYAKIGTM